MGRFLCVLRLRHRHGIKNIVQVGFHRNPGHLPGDGILPHINVVIEAGMDEIGRVAGQSQPHLVIGQTREIIPVIARGAVIIANQMPFVNNYFLIFEKLFLWQGRTCVCFARESVIR